MYSGSLFFSSVDWRQMMWCYCRQERADLSIVWGRQHLQHWRWSQHNSPGRRQHCHCKTRC